MVLFSVGTKHFLFFKSSIPALSRTDVDDQLVSGDLSVAVNRQLCESYNHSSFSAEVENLWT